MNQLWTKAVLLVFLLTFVLAPFAGFAPLMLLVLVLGIAWFVSSIWQALVSDEGMEEDMRSRG
ncbi:MAG: hypothetical protein SW833_04900 [Cyanobacteriota bacterium]|nr:hypothetical protein [Cyanobacteriota bacterium]